MTESTSATSFDTGGKLEAANHSLKSATTLGAVLAEQASSDDGTAVAYVELDSGEKRRVTVHKHGVDQTDQPSRIFPCVLWNGTDDGLILAACVLNTNGTGRLLIPSS